MPAISLRHVCSNLLSSLRVSCRMLVPLLLTCLGVASARGQSINVDFGARAGTPSDTFAAAGLPGVWNNCGSQWVDVYGTPIGATLDLCSYGDIFYYWDQHATCGEFESLFDEFLPVTDFAQTFDISGLQPGLYRLIVYAWGGTFAVIEVPGATPEVQGTAGGWPGGLEEGITHVAFTVNVSSGSIEFWAYGGIDSQGNINGFQLVSLDCNNNGVLDDTDIGNGASQDCNANGYPDECEPATDCNSNGISDICDITDNPDSDCNNNGVADECEPSDDCNGNGVQDICDVAICPNDCNKNGVPDDCEPSDCNANGVHDACDILFGSSGDCNINAIPDDCEGDCNSNNVPDDCDLAQGTSRDCNANGVLDECDLASGASIDGDGNGVPDECQELVRVPDDYASIQSAIEGVNDGSTIIVSDGLYRERVRFSGNSVTLKSENGPTNCVIDRGVWVGSDANHFSLISGFTVTNTATHGGPAIQIRYSGLTVRNCRFINSSAHFDGGGISFFQSDALIQNCVISGNSGGRQGGGIFCFLSNPRIENCLITDNHAGSEGGAIGGTGSSPTIVNTTIIGNTSVGRGAAIYVRNISFPTLANCTITANASEQHEAVYLDSSSQLSVVNSIIWGNTPDQITGDALIGFSNVQGGWPGLGNIDADPLFVAPNIGNIHLSLFSPCVDAGDPTYVPPAGETDIDGGPRLIGIAVDMGADEYISQDCNDNTSPDDQDLISGSSFDCNVNNIPDECDADPPPTEDCNQNGRPDACDLLEGTSTDCGDNGVPNECEGDCQGNGVPDDCDIVDGTSTDCNANTVPDECDIADATSTDCNANGTPDECEPDNDGDGVIDVCDSCPLDAADDSDGDGACDSDDECPNNPLKVFAGACGCGEADTDSDSDGVSDCLDVCPGVDDAAFAPECDGAIPTVSAWGLIALALLLVTGSKIRFGRFT